MKLVDGEEWIPLRQAVVEVAQVYSRFMLCEPAAALETAQAAIVRRLNYQFADSRASRWMLIFNKQGDTPEWRQDNQDAPEIPGPFWSIYERADIVFADDWIAGEFSFSCTGRDEVDDWAPDAFGFAVGVEVTRKGLPIIGDDNSNDGISNARFRGIEQIIEERRGARRKWNWEGAICEIVAQANNNPDGLPEGYGAQAKIGQMLAQWFRNNQNGEPAQSEIGLRAAKIMQTIESHLK